MVLTTKNDQTQHYIHQKHKTEKEKTVLANKTIYTLISYAFYDLQSGNGVGPILTAPEPTQGPMPMTPYFIRLLVSKLAKAGKSVTGFAGEALPNLKLFLRQFLRKFISLTSYRDPSSKVGFAWGIILSKDNM